MGGRKTTHTPPTPEQEIAMLRAQLASLARDNESLAADNARLAAEMSGRVDELEAGMARLVELVKLANLRFFAPRSERPSIGTDAMAPHIGKPLLGQPSGNRARLQQLTKAMFISGTPSI